MKKLIKLILIVFLVLVIKINLIYAQNNSNETNESNNQSISENQTTEKEIEIIKFFPQEVKIGNVQFNLQIQNNKNETIENVYAIVKGRGFSTYDVIPIEKIGYRERDYIFVNGNLAEGGEINLTITILNNVFYQKIIVFDVSKKIEEEKLARINEISQEIEALKQNYLALELELNDKKNKGYDVSGISLTDLKKFLRDAESDLLVKNLQNAEANLQLAKEEYSYQKSKLDNTKILPFISRLKENALVISAIIGAVLAIIAISEILKKKTESTVHLARKVAKKIKERRVRK